MCASFSPTLDSRSRQLLRTLISCYIQNSEPVGSKTLAQQAGLDISPATIRNILADLEELGLLNSPHTSAGRVPTAHGYRMFVDSLVQMQPPSEDDIRRLRVEMAGGGTQALLGNASEILSAMTHFVGVVSAPRREQFVFRHIDFVPLDARQIMAILIFADNEVQNRVIEPRRVYEPGELERVSNYLNAHFIGRTLADIRTTVLCELRKAKDEMEQLLAHSLDLASQMLVPNDSEDIVVTGQTRLMALQDLSDMDRLRELFEIFASKREILQLLERTINAPGVRIFIGEETGMVSMEDISLVTAPYAAHGQVLGVLGVIGPKRMAYDRVIPLVQVVAQVLGTALEPPTMP
ncbi:heat-inducible transcriptional repressor HrcA [Xylella fastidiosa]|uniref:heat-inducible transcriptional repressor HrcA n=1 Tax=Xylella fastidiosa TaxID=2371 RepID=UPI000FFF1D6B|nr:heat-inducible transcriptional repressor HrcA [Xylella fastidiosa]RWA37346.1 heat-inducible transcriptional repressor HrcA [Xylella fastidiosa subsp. multiplex]